MSRLLLANLKLGGKCFSETNVLAYFADSLIKSFIALVPEQTWKFFLQKFVQRLKNVALLPLVHAEIKIVAQVDCYGSRQN